MKSPMTKLGCVLGVIALCAIMASCKTPIEFPMWLFIVALAALLLFGAAPAARGEWQPDPLGYKSSKNIQGLCSVAVMLHHLSQRIAFSSQDPGALGAFVNAGVFFVGLFFFFSGYGLFKSLQSKPDYLRSFFTRRIPAVLIPLALTNIIYMVFEMLRAEHYDLSRFLLGLVSWSMPNPHAWYIIELLMLYAAFWLAFRFIKNRKAALAALSAFVVVFVCVCVFRGHGSGWFRGEWWYNTTLLFPLGMYAAMYGKRLEEIAKKRWVVLCVGSFAVCAALFAANLWMLDNVSYYAGYAESFACLGVQLPCVAAFVAFIALLLLKVRFDNAALRLLGSMTLEIYLIHNLFVEGYNGGFVYIESRSMYVLCTIVSALAVAYVLNRFNARLISGISAVSEKRRKQPAARE